MKKIETAIRIANPWYNMENIYCFLRLIQKFESGEELITYDELEVFQKEIMSEVTLDVNNVVPLRMHLNHLGESIIFNSSEDLFLIKEAHEMLALLDATPEETLEYARLFADEFKEATYQIDMYMLYSDIKKLFEEIEELDTIETQQTPKAVQKERTALRH